MARFLIIVKPREIPVPPEVMKEAIPAQIAYMKQLQAQGKIEAIAGLATEKGSCFIANVDSHEELQMMAFRSPMWPFVNWETHPLTTFDGMEKAVQEMLSRLP